MMVVTPDDTIVTVSPLTVATLVLELEKATGSPEVDVAVRVIGAEFGVTDASGPNVIVWFGLVMVSRPLALVIEPCVFAATQLYRLPLRLGVVLETISVDKVSKAYGVLGGETVVTVKLPVPLVIGLHVLPPSVLTCHCSTGAGYASTSTLKVAAAPALVTELLG
jgi:hypothetical protein